MLLSRRQFKSPCSPTWELIKKKLVRRDLLRHEATTYEVAALIDRGEDYMLETAILKVFSTEALWQGSQKSSRFTAARGTSPTSPTNG